MTEPPELRTERLLMRAPRYEDFDRWAEIYADPDIGAGLRAERRPLTPHEAFVDMSVVTAHWALRGFGHWVLEELDDAGSGRGVMVGRAGLYYPPDWPGLEVGWAVAREHRGKGYAAEAGRAACQWAHGELGAEHILSLIHPDNAASARVAHKLGLTCEGRHTTRGFVLDVYGAELPLGGSGGWRAGTVGAMTENDEDRERTSMDADPATPEDPLLRREEEAARREAGHIGGDPPEYENEEGDPAREADRALIEGGEGVEEGFELAEEGLRDTASHAENRYNPAEHDFGDEESAGDADAVSGEPDEIDVTETVRDPNAGPGEDPGEGPGISHDR